MAHSGFRHYAGLKGTKQLYVGADDSVYQYQTIAQAVAAAQNNDTIYLAPEVHTVAAQVVINKPLRFVGMGGSSSKCHVTGTVATSLFSIELVAQAAASEVYFQDIRFYHGTTAQDVFSVNNTSIAQTLAIVCSGCEIMVYNSSSASYGFNVSHATAGQIITLDIASKRRLGVSTVNMTCKNAGDRVRFYGMELRPEGNASACICSADNLAAGVELHGCLVTATKGVSGGHSTQTAKSYFSYSAGAALVTTDLIGSHTETIVGS
jgi:hypothetical protein